MDAIERSPFIGCLPLYLRFVEARRHDSVSVVVALAEFRELFPQFKISNYVQLNILSKNHLIVGLFAVPISIRIQL